MTLHMCVYFRTKFQVSNIILTSFRQRDNFTLSPTPKQTPKKPTLISVGMKKKSLFIIFHQLLVVKYCLRPEIASLTILGVKRGLSCNFAKTLKDRHFTGHSSRDSKFSITTCKSSKLSSASLCIFYRRTCF